MAKKIGIREQVKSGSISAKDALAKLVKKGNGAGKSETAQWLRRLLDDKTRLHKYENTKSA